MESIDGAYAGGGVGLSEVEFIDVVGGVYHGDGAEVEVVEVASAGVNI